MESQNLPQAGTETSYRVNAETWKIKLSGKTVIVAEDDLHSYHLLEYIFKNSGAQVMHAKTGKDLMDLLVSVTPDLILLDINMPEIDGLSCLRQIISLDISSKIIIQSAYNHVDEIANFRLLGAHAFIAKPILRTKLFQVIDSVLL